MTSLPMACEKRRLRKFVFVYRQTHASRKIKKQSGDNFVFMNGWLGIRSSSAVYIGL
jgi:hypothetical protein